MFRLFLIVVVLALFSTGQAQWNLLPPSSLPILNNDIYFRKGLEACQAKITENNKTYKNIMYIRAGPGYEYNLNDTDDNVHVCRVARVPPPTYVIQNFYVFVDLSQGKQVVADKVDIESSTNQESTTEPSLDVLLPTEF